MGRRAGCASHGGSSGSKAAAARVNEQGLLVEYEALTTTTLQEVGSAALVAVPAGRARRPVKVHCAERRRAERKVLEELGAERQTIDAETARAQRKRKRALVRCSMTADPGKSLLQSYSITEASRERYLRSYREFTHWSGANLSSLTEAAMDEELCAFVEDMFWDGEELGMGTLALAATLHFHPALGRGVRGRLPETRQALQGWKRLGPSRARLPLPWLLAAAAAHWMALNLSVNMALLTVLAFFCYLRPGVAARLVLEQLTPPVKLYTGGARKPEHGWALNLHPQEWEEPSKTGAWDETVEVTDRDELEWLGDCLASRLRQSRGLHMRARAMGSLVDRSEGEPLMAETQQEWSRALQCAFKELRIPAANQPHLYRLRHGGASHDVSARWRTLDEVQKRGAWRSTRSLARYAKPARINEQLRALGDDVLREVERREAELKLMLPRWLEKPP